MSYAQIISFDHGYALVFPRNGNGFPVRSLQLVGDSIICLSPEIKAYAKSDISKILVRNATPKGNGMGVGAFIGAYAMHYAVGRATNQTGAFLSYSGYGADGNSAIIWTTLLGVALGSGIGYLVDSGPSSGSHLTPYIFAGNSEVINEQWKHFLQETSDYVAIPKLHVAVSGGSVSTPTRDGYRKMLQEEGFSHFDESSFNSGSFFSDFDESSAQRATNFNWLRKAAIEYSVTDNIRAGILFSWLSEPVLYARKGEIIFGSPSGEIYEFIQRLNGTGYYATGGFHYYLTRKRDFDIYGTIGVGVANMNHQIKAIYRRNTSDTPTEAFVTDTKTYASFVASAGLNYALYHNLTLGLTANYMYGGSASMSDIFIIDLPAMDVTYGTTDIGFSLGMHF